MYDLSLQDIVYYIDNKPLFAGLSLQVQKERVVAIVGTSGVGKSTLFHIAAGLLMPSLGTVWIDGVDRTGQAGFAGYMLQKDLLLPFKTIYDNLALPLLLQKQNPKTIAQKINSLSPVFGIEMLMRRYPHELSGGQKQRAALLRAYLSNAHLMLLDEPFSALDYLTKMQLYDWFVQFQKSRALTCLIITHDIDEAIRLADEIYVLGGFPARFCGQFVVPKDPLFLQSPEYWKLKQDILQAMREH